jgi:mRNA-degrading endonuclease YafQ of YafQ-DinJ toxin-antitoxin module
MKIQSIIFTPKFDKQWRSMELSVKIKARKALELFRQNPFHPSLRLHDLHGKLQNFWSLSIDRKNRIIVEIKEDTAILHSIGTHAIYDHR